MRIVAWNCNMALHAKAAGLLALKPDVAVISECAEPDRLRLRGASWLESEPVWIGRNPHKGLAVWAQNASSGSIRKRSLGPLRRAMARYRDFLSHPATLVAGDLNSNTIWDKPGWRINHSTKVRLLEEQFGLVSAWHAVTGEPHGAETVPTLYWRDRTKDGPTYHIDYVFLPAQWLASVTELTVGTYEEWCGSGLSDHVPILVDVGL